MVYLRGVATYLFESWSVVMRGLNHAELRRCVGRRGREGVEKRQSRSQSNVMGASKFRADLIGTVI